MRSGTCPCRRSGAAGVEPNSSIFLIASGSCYKRAAEGSSSIGADEDVLCRRSRAVGYSNADY